MADTATLPPLPDGIYFGLPEDRYHADSADGSTDIRLLRKGANEYWAAKLDPKRKAWKRTPAMVLGSAVHKLLLEGHDDFKRNYVRGPYGSDSDLSSAEKSALTKDAKKKLMEHQELLAQDDYDFCLGIKAIMDEDPELQGALDGGYSEVSIFWTTKDKIRLKARFDKMKIRGYGDIKTLANEMRRQFDIASHMEFVNRRHDMQIEHYNEARRHLPQLFSAGKIFIAEAPIASVKETPAIKELMAFLEECAKQKTFGAQMIYVPKANAPDCYSFVISEKNPGLQIARDDIDIALMQKRDALKKFKPGQRWTPGRIVSELDFASLPYGLSRGN